MMHLVWVELCEPMDNHCIKIAYGIVHIDQDDLLGARLHPGKRARVSVSADGLVRCD